MADVGVAHDEERAPLAALGVGGVRGELEQREDGVVVDRIVAQPALRGLVAHERGDVVERFGSPGEACTARELAPKRRVVAVLEPVGHVARAAQLGVQAGEVRHRDAGVDVVREVPADVERHQDEARRRATA